MIQKEMSLTCSLLTLRILAAFLLALLLLIQLVQPVNAAGGVPILRTFEDLSVGTAVFNQYRDVTFLTGDADSHPITIIQPSLATASPSHALQYVSASTCEFTCATQLTMQFVEAQYRVLLSTGLAKPVSGVALTMLLQGFKDNPTSSSAIPIVQSVAPCLGPGPTPITTPLQIDDNTTSIHYAVLSIVKCSNPLNPYSYGSSNGTILLDNLLYNRPLNPPGRENIPPIIIITDPTNGSTVVGKTPDRIAVILQASVQETAIMSMMAQVNGHPAMPMHYWSNGVNSFTAGIYLDDSVGLIEGVNTVVVKAVDFDQPANTSTASVTFTFKKQPLPLPSRVDIIPTGYEVTQTIDTGPRSIWAPTGEGFVARDIPYFFDPPLIQGKPTLVRIYAAASGTNIPLQNVPATAFVERDNCINNCTIPGADDIFSPVSGWTKLYPGGTLIPNLNGITVPILGTPQSVLTNAAPHLDKTWNFYLPATWTQSNLVIHINLNAGNYSKLPHGISKPECISNTNDTCNHNNEVDLHLRFTAAPTITINYVMIHVVGSYNNQSYNDVPSMEEVKRIFAGLNELYPMHVMMGGSGDITVSPAINKDDLLNKIGVCPKLIEACAARPLTLGIFPVDQMKPYQFAANEYDPKTGAFVAGYGTVGGWGAWANSDNPTDAAHELAHNIGFDHWACENGVNYGLPGSGRGGTDECASFPIPHGGTGVYGTDIAGAFAGSNGQSPFWSVIPPGNISANNTPHAHDFMSYGGLCEVYGGGRGCDLGEWVSWYDYNILLNHTDAASYDTDDPPALLVSGRISPSEVATFQPVYQTRVNHPISDTIVEDDPNDIYTMQGYDGKGNVLFIHNFEPLKLDDHANYNKSFVFAEAVPIIPDLQRITVLHGAKIMGTLINPAPGTEPTVSITAPINSSVWPVGKQQTITWTSNSPAGVPLFAEVEYSPDGGTTRYQLGHDITSTSLTINPDELQGSTNAMIYVQVSDGMNTAIASAGPFAVQVKPPKVLIITPSGNSQAIAYMPLSLEGTAYDRQEVLTDKQFQWSSDRDGALGMGRLITVSKLSIGHHTLTLTVTDSHGLVSQDTVQIEVVAFGASQSPSFNWSIFWAIAIAVLLLVLVLAVILLRWRQTARGHG